MADTVVRTDGLYVMALRSSVECPDLAHQLGRQDDRAQQTKIEARINAAVNARFWLIRGLAAEAIGIGELEFMGTVPKRIR